MNKLHISYKLLDQADISLLTQLIRLYAEVFETAGFTMPSKDHLKSLLHNQQIIFCVAISGENVVGGLTAHVLPSVYQTANEVYLYDLAVNEEHQRQGVGKNLISFLKNLCVQAGYKEMYVQANAEDNAAIDFYRITGAQPENVVHYTYNISAPGKN
jgi:aminoglycoside 3-N-acetyltransferase I